jgi:hypothetical protein
MHGKSMLELMQAYEKLALENARLKTAHVALKQRLSASDRNFLVLAGTLIHLRKCFAENEKSSEALLHALSAALIIKKDEQLGVPIEELEKLGSLFFGNEKNTSIAN